MLNGPIVFILNFGRVKLKHLAEKRLNLIFFVPVIIFYKLLNANRRVNLLKLTAVDKIKCLQTELKFQAKKIWILNFFVCLLKFVHRDRKTTEKWHHLQSLVNTLPSVLVIYSKTITVFLRNTFLHHERDAILSLDRWDWICKCSQAVVCKTNCYTNKP